MKEIQKLLNGCKRVVFLDFEGTQFSQEIIAVGAVKVDLDNKNQIKKVYPGFKQYVKAHNEVGNLVVKLTGITDELLNKEGINFLYTTIHLEKYVGKRSGVKYITYGNFDMRLLHQTAEISGLDKSAFIKSIYDNYIDFTAILNKYIKSPKGTQLSLMDALKVFKITPEGEAHDPLFDAQNLMLLYREFLKQKSTVVEEYKNVLLYKTNYPKPIQKIINDLKTKSTANIEDLTKYIEEDL